MKRVLLGRAGVDSGQLMVVDPCYVMDGLDYGTVCQVTLAEENTDTDGGVIPGLLGVAFSSGYGDGLYEVYGYIASNQETGGWGERVAKVEIVMIPELFESPRPFEDEWE